MIPKMNETKGSMQVLFEMLGEKQIHVSKKHENIFFIPLFSSCTVLLIFTPWGHKILKGTKFFAWGFKTEWFYKWLNHKNYFLRNKTHFSPARK